METKNHRGKEREREIEREKKEEGRNSSEVAEKESER